MKYHFPRSSPITSQAKDWPQGWFKDKECRNCGVVYTPVSPCNLYCSDDCANDGKTTAYLKRSYGITLADYTKMLEQQEHKCAICDGPGFKMKGQHNVLLVVDHDHETGDVRGLLCHNCNRALGLLQDSTKVVGSALSYLESATTRSKDRTPKWVEALSPEAPGDDIV